MTDLSPMPGAPQTATKMYAALLVNATTVAAYFFSNGEHWLSPEKAFALAGVLSAFVTYVIPNSPVSRYLSAPVFHQFVKWTSLLATAVAGGAFVVGS